MRSCFQFLCIWYFYLSVFWFAVIFYVMCARPQGHVLYITVMLFYLQKAFRFQCVFCCGKKCWISVEITYSRQSQNSLASKHFGVFQKLKCATIINFIVSDLWFAPSTSKNVTDMLRGYTYLHMYVNVLRRAPRCLTTVFSHFWWSMFFHKLRVLQFYLIYVRQWDLLKNVWCVLMFSSTMYPISEIII